MDNNNLEEALKTQRMHCANLSSDFYKKNKEILSEKKSIVEKYKLDEEESLGMDLLIHRFLESHIVNGVCPIYTREPLQLDRIEQVCKKHALQYHRYKKFTGLPVKFKHKGINFTAVFFCSGKINCIGLQQDTPQYLRKMTSILTKYEYQMAGKPIISQSTKKVANRVYSVQIPKLIPLDSLNLFNKISRWKLIKYNNQSFPGVIYKVVSSRAKILFFKTGSMIITGVTSKLCKLNILKEFLDILGQYLQVRKAKLNT